MSKKARDLLATYDRVMTAKVRDLGREPTPESVAALLELGRARRALGSAETGATLGQAAAAAEALGDRASWRCATIELGAWLVASGDETVGRAYLERALDAATREKDERAPRDLAAAAAELASARALAGDL